LSADGRISDPKMGWKGRGLWTTYATRAPSHMEGGKGTTSKVVHIQLRPDPLDHSQYLAKPARRPISPISAQNSPARGCG